MYLVVWTSTVWVGNGNLTVPGGAKAFTKPENVKRFSKRKWAEGCETTWYKWNVGGINGAGKTSKLTDEEFKAIGDIAVCSTCDSTGGHWARCPKSEMKG